MYCGQCGTINQDGGETCQVCGSSLEQRAGPGQCETCGGLVGEHDRYCPSCGTERAQPDEPHFDPGPSFVDDAPLDVKVDDLPGWLQDLARSHAASNDAALPSSPGARVMTGEDRLPDWLQAPRPDDAGVHGGTSSDAWATSSASHSSQAPEEESFSFITEDDLPEWLRTLSDEEPLPPAADAGVDVEVEAPHEVQMAEETSSIPVPAVSIAWLAQPRSIDPDTYEIAKSQFAPLEPVPSSVEVPVPAGPPPTPSRSAAAASDVTPAAAVAARTTPESTASSKTEETVAVVEEQKPGTRRARILILVLAVIVALLIVYLIVNGAR